MRTNSTQAPLVFLTVESHHLLSFSSKAFLLIIAHTQVSLSLASLSNELHSTLLFAQILSFSLLA
jgi:hypothetical protein